MGVVGEWVSVVGWWAGIWCVWFIGGHSGGWCCGLVGAVMCGK